MRAIALAIVFIGVLHATKGQKIDKVTANFGGAVLAALFICLIMGW